MAVTLAQSKLNVTDDLQLGVIDEYRKSSWLLNNLQFADVASPVGGGAGYTYAYTRLITQPTAEFRSVNSEYTPSEVQKQRYSADLKIFGGSFEVDRIIAGTGGIVDEVTLQMQQKVKAAGALFNDTVINGNSSADAETFDGLDVALTGTDTEWNKEGSIIDLSTASNIEANGAAFLLMLHKCLGKLDGTPTAFLCNADMKATLEYLAKHQGRYQERQDDFGNYISTYNGIPIIDVGNKAGTNDEVIGNDSAKGTSLYIARLGLDGFHAVSRNGAPIIQTWMPDFSTAGAVKKGEVEMVAACALKSTNAAGVIRGIKVQ